MRRPLFWYNERDYYSKARRGYPVKWFQRFYLDKEKDIIVDLHKDQSVCYAEVSDTSLIGKRPLPAASVLTAQGSSHLLHIFGR